MDKVDVEGKSNSATTSQWDAIVVRATANLVGKQVEYHKCERILVGDIKHPHTGVKEGTKLLHAYMQFYEDNPMEINWATKEYITSWKCMKEKVLSTESTCNTFEIFGT